MSAARGRKVGCVQILGILILLVCIGACAHGVWVDLFGGSSQSNKSGSQAHARATSTEVSGTPTATATLGPTATPKPSPTPTHAPQWTTVQSFQGNGNKKTTTFAVPNSWKLIWSCDPSSDYSGEYNVIVDVVRPDGSYVDPGAVNTICQAGNTGDSTQEYQGGTVYLDVQSEDVWTIQVQVLK